MTDPPGSGGGPRRTFPPYGPDHVAAIKDAIATHADLRCPVCHAPLGVFPFNMLGSADDEAFEIRCEPCRRFLVVRDLPDGFRHA